LANSKSIGLGAGLALVLIGVISLGYELWGTPRGATSGAFYSDDDGTSFFRQSGMLFPPFEHDGREADAAQVFKSGKGLQFVGLLVRYTSDAKKALDDAYAQFQAGKMEKVDMAREIGRFTTALEVKIPGPGNKWMPRDQIPNGSIKSPDGTDWIPVPP